MATTAVQGSARVWTITLTIPRPARIRWRWLAVAALIAGAVFVVAVAVAGARQTYAPISPAPDGPLPCDASTADVTDPLPRAAADPAPVCPTLP
ncbi:MAG TPA: hypothetical protein VIW24_04410 [Aldersonia sp.]